MPPIKVFYIINSMALGGAERQMAALVSRLPRDRFEPVLCCLGPENAYQYLLPSDQPRYVFHGKNKIETFSHVKKWLALEKPQIIHSFMEWANLVARICAPAAGDPVVITSVRSRMMRPDYALIEGLLSRRSDAVVTNSVGTLEELAKIQRVAREKLLVIDNIVDFEKFSPADEKEKQAARKEFSLSGKVILLPGRMSISKNQIGLVLAAAKLLKNGALPADASFVFAGRYYNQSIKYLLKFILKRTGTERYFRYLGPVAEVRKLYAACDWVALPSLYEGLPNAALEAHACARPLVVSRAANLDGIVADGETGFEFATGSVRALAKALERAFSTPSENVARMGEAGRKRVYDRFRPEAALDAVTNLYLRLLKSKNRTYAH